MFAAAVQGQQAGVSARMVVTVEAGKGHAAPPDRKLGDFSVRQSGDKTPHKVEEWVPLQGERAGSQRAILIDDGADSDLSLQFGDLRQFSLAQPASTQVGVYYMRLPLAQPGIAASPLEAL